MKGSGKVWGEGASDSRYIGVIDVPSTMRISSRSSYKSSGEIGSKFTSSHPEVE